MDFIIVVAKVVIFISIINVWFFRFSKESPYRGGDASSMKAEFATYGLSETMVYLIGTLKVLSAISLLVSIWVTQLAIPSSALMALLMLGAIFMHIKVKDPLKKSVPAFIFLLLSLLILSYIFFAS